MYSLLYSNPISFLAPRKRGRPKKTEIKESLDDDDDDEDGSDADSLRKDKAGSEEEDIERPRLRKRRRSQKGKDPKKEDAARRHKEAVRKITQVIRKPVAEQTNAEKRFLATQTTKAFNEAKRKHNLKQRTDDRYD